MITTSKTARVIPHIVLVLMTVLALLPILLLFVASITDEQELIKNGYSFFPKKLSLYSFQYIFRSSATIFRAYGITLFVTIVGTLANMTLTVTLAYPLSRPEVKCRNIVTFLVFFTMLFSGGMVPNYILVKELGLLNSRWALVLPYICNTWNMLIMRNFFYAIPDALEEAAYLDGANQFTILIRVILPLSLPSIATIAMFYAVSFWNAWFPGVMYLTDAKLVPVQNVMRTIIISATAALEDMGVTIDDVQQAPTSHTLKCASIVVTTLPILCVYPFIQKYFVKGVMVGSVKG